MWYYIEENQSRSLLKKKHDYFLAAAFFFGLAFFLGLAFFFGLAFFAAFGLAAFLAPAFLGDFGFGDGLLRAGDPGAAAADPSSGTGDNGVAATAFFGLAFLAATFFFGLDFLGPFAAFFAPFLAGAFFAPAFLGDGDLFLAGDAPDPPDGAARLVAFLGEADRLAGDFARGFAGALFLAVLSRKMMGWGRKKWC